MASSNSTGRLIEACHVPLVGGYAIQGTIHEDTLRRFHDGDPIYASRIMSKEGPIVLTQNSIHEVENWAV